MSEKSVGSSVLVRVNVVDIMSIFWVCRGGDRRIGG